MTRVLIAGGGTGGHLFPGIAVAEEFRQRDPASEVLFVGSRRGIEARAVPRAGFQLALLPVSGLRRTGWWRRLLGLARLPFALLRALTVVLRFRPVVAISVGGYAAGPAVLAAFFLGVPCFVMEQNTVPGVTNRILGKLARRVFAGLPTTGYAASKVEVVGNPVRSEMAAVRGKPYEPSDPPTLLAFGGSQGARALNDALLEAAPVLSASGWRIIHQTGADDCERVRAAYQAAGAQAEVVAFIDDMAAAYERADLVLCRSGAMTLAELTVCGRPALLVPYPYAVDDHQTANAQTLVTAGAALLVPQQQLSGAQLAQLLQDLAAAPDRLTEMAAQSRRLGKPRAATAIVDALTEEVRRV